MLGSIMVLIVWAVKLIRCLTDKKAITNQN